MSKMAGSRCTKILTGDEGEAGSASRGDHPDKVVHYALSKGTDGRKVAVACIPYLVTGGRCTFVGHYSWTTENEEDGLVDMVDSRFEFTNDPGKRKPEVTCWSVPAISKSGDYVAIDIGSHGNIRTHVLIRDMTQDTDWMVPDEEVGEDLTGFIFCRNGDSDCLVTMKEDSYRRYFPAARDIQEQSHFPSGYSKRFVPVRNSDPVFVVGTRLGSFLYWQENQFKEAEVDITVPSITPQSELDQNDRGSAQAARMRNGNIRLVLKGTSQETPERNLLIGEIVCQDSENPRVVISQYLHLPGIEKSKTDRQAVISLSPKGKFLALLTRTKQVFIYNLDSRQSETKLGDRDWTITVSGAEQLCSVAWIDDDDTEVSLAVSYLTKDEFAVSVYRKDNDVFRPIEQEPIICQDGLRDLLSQRKTCRKLKSIPYRYDMCVVPGAIFVTASNIGAFKILM